MPEYATVDIITYNNGKKRFPIELQAQRLGLRIHVVARNIRPWTWAAKITEPKALMEKFFGPNQFVMLVDGNDTIFTRPPHIHEIESVLKQYGADVLFCPTCANWPPNEACRAFERALSGSRKPHLSSGAYVGTVTRILEGMRWIEERRRKGWLKFGGRFDDQLAWRKVHLAFHPKVAIDTEGILFNRFDHIFLADRQSCLTTT